MLRNPAQGGSSTFRVFSERMQKQRARTGSLVPRRFSFRPPSTHPSQCTRVKRVGPEGGTVRHEAVSTSSLLLHVLRAFPERAQSALSGVPKHHKARLIFRTSVAPTYHTCSKLYKIVTFYSVTEVMPQSKLFPKTYRKAYHICGDDLHQA